MSACPMCNGATRDMAHQRVFTTATEHVIYPAHYSRCDVCDADFVSPEQANRNDALQREAQGHSQGTTQGEKT